MRRRKLEEPSKRFVVDTSVLVEFIIENSPYREPVSQLLTRAPVAVELYVTPLTVAELFYVASKVYAYAAVKNANQEARNFVEWVLARTEVVELDLDTLLRAGELRKRLRIALPDCCAIAAAEKIGALALFLKPEKEMLPRLEELKGLPIKFLAEPSRQSVL